MNDESTKNMPDSRRFEERVFARFDSIFARFDSIDARLQSLIETEAARHDLEVKSMWEQLRKIDSLKKDNVGVDQLGGGNAY